MSNPSPDTVPDPEEVLGLEQEHRDMVPVPVTVEGPIRNQPLAVDHWSGRTYTVTGPAPIQVAGISPRRARIMFLNVGIKVVLAPSESEARSLNGVTLAGNGALVVQMFHRGEVWAMAETGSTQLAIYEEFYN
jgi:hypothetical protein